MGVGVKHLRAHGNTRHRIGPVFTRLVFAAARLPVARKQVRPVLEVEQRVHAFVGHKHHVAAVAAVATGGAAFGDVRLATPRHDAVAAIAGPRLQDDLVDKCAHDVPRGYPQTALPHSLCAESPAVERQRGPWESPGPRLVALCGAFNLLRS